MTEVVDGWLDLARRDARVGEGLLGLGEIEAAAFHVQQAAEKLIKALLIEQHIMPPRVHDLARLLSLLPTDVESPMSDLDAERISTITTWAVELRYDDPASQSPSVEEVRQALSPVVAYLLARDR